MNPLASSSTVEAIKASTVILQKISNTAFNAPSIIVLLVSMATAFVAGRIVASALRRLVAVIGRRADSTENLHTVNRMRRYETYLILSIAIIKVGLVLLGLYFWWEFVHPEGQPTAIIGASALAVIIISGALSPVLRDVASGSFMMAEQWFGVGDHIRIEPFNDMQGVVERVTLRSTRIRGLNGEIIWVSNQNIQAVRLAPKGIRTMALEMFVTDVKAGERLIKLTNQRLPVGPLLVVSPLDIVSSEKVGDSLWHITAIGETAPAREWLIEKSAVDLIKSLDESANSPTLAHGPLARFADPIADRRFGRTIRNARKKPSSSRPRIRTRRKS